MSSIGMLTSSGLWFHRKVSGGNDGGKKCVSLCTQETKNLLRLHGIVAKIPEESKCSLSYAFPTTAGFLRFPCVYPVSQRGPETFTGSTSKSMRDWVILQSESALGLGNHTFANCPSHLSASLPLDVDLMVQIEVSTVCTERLVCT